MDDDTLTLDLDRVYLEIDSTRQQEAWQASQALATANSRWRAYLNQVCLATVQPWLESEYAAGQALPSPQPALLPTMWELVTGSAIEVGPWRFILVPTEAIDLEELRVPQEWVDVPSWVGDYYLTVQINLDEGWVHIANFTTHAQLRDKSQYDWRDRAYALKQGDAISDLNVLWIAQELYPEEVKRASVPALPSLPLDHANALIEQLGNVEAVPLPRLAIPFERWGALLAHGGWRSQIAHARWGRPTPLSALDWLSRGVTRLGRQLGWEAVSYEAAIAGARSDQATSTQTALTRQVNIDGMAYALQISPLSGLTGQSWRFALHPVQPGGRIPAGVSLRLLTEDLQPFERNEVMANEPAENIFIDVELTPGEGVVWETTPKASQYEPEILRF